MADEELCYMGAAEALDRFKAKRLSPVELMRALIARAEAVEPAINAFPMTYFERALEQAGAAEARYMKTDGRLRALEGIAVAIKNETALKGERTTYGSLACRDHVDTADAPSVERLKRAGAIFHAGIAAGKFHGVMAPMTPIGSRVTSTSIPGRTDCRCWPAMRTVSPAKYLKICPARPNSPLASASVLPSSRASNSPSSSPRLRISVPARSRMSARA